MESARRKSIAISASTAQLAKPWQRWINYSILLFTNFLNYVDRYSLAGILIDVKKDFKIPNAMAGFIFSDFLIFYTMTSPLYGYLGDRYSRKILLAISLIIWNIANVGCSFSDSFWLFLLLRGLLGIGQSGFTTIAPTIIGDLFGGTDRLFVLSLFYTAIPVGNGIAYVVGGEATRLFHSWRWSMRLTLPINAFALFLILFVMKEPKRGEVEGNVRNKKTTFLQDLKYLFVNRSYMTATLGFTLVAFTSGAVNWWLPTINEKGLSTYDPDVDMLTESTTFGIVNIASGFIGLSVGYCATFMLKNKTPSIVPCVCGIGIFIAVPLLVASGYISMYSRAGLYSCIFFGTVFMNVNWALTADICMDVVVPYNRGLAVGLQLLIGHMLGDVGSPYLTGLISDKMLDVYDAESEDDNNEYYALRNAYTIACCCECLGGLFYFINAYFYFEDIKKAERDVAALENE